MATIPLRPLLRITRFSNLIATTVQTVDFLITYRHLNSTVKCSFDPLPTSQPPAKAGGLDKTTKVWIRVTRPVYVSVLKLSSPLGSK